MSTFRKAQFPDNRLEADSLACERGVRMLFEGLSLSLGAGQALQILGPNGAGKTSLLRIIVGLSGAERGERRWNGQTPESDPGIYRRSLAWLGHKPALKQALTPIENLQSHAGLHHSAWRGSELDARIAAALDILGVDRARHRAVANLSAGQRQRVALARVVLSDAPLWVLDEPATALDGDGIERLEGALTDHLSRNGLLLFTSHQALALAPSSLTTLEIGVH